MIKIKEEAQQIEDYVIELRRYFHMHPEIGMEEFKTSERIQRELDALGIPWKLCNQTGIMATIGQGSKMIALRADMDALPIQEKNDVSYVSKNEGVMHACGHDGHVAALLGAAKILKEHESELSIRVRLIFQPSEERSEPQFKGSQIMCDAGAMEDVDEVYGLHVFTDMPAGQVSFEAGPRMAATSVFKAKICGKSGHGGKPHLCKDAMLAACASVMQLQSIVSRELDPTEPAVVTVGKLECGTQYNIISGEAYLEGTVRTFSKQALDSIANSVVRIIEKTAETYDQKAEVSFTKARRLPITNDIQLSNRMMKYARDVFDDEQLKHIPPIMLGEDFNVYLDHVPGIFSFVGAGNPEIDCIYPNHHEKFNIDESVLKNCVMLHLLAVEAAQKELGE